jgi:hypothetical protein
LDVIFLCELDGPTGYTLIKPLGPARPETFSSPELKKSSAAAASLEDSSTVKVALAE